MENIKLNRLYSEYPYPHHVIFFEGNLKGNSVKSSFIVVWKADELKIRERFEWFKNTDEFEIINLN